MIESLRGGCEAGQGWLVVSNVVQHHFEYLIWQICRGTNNHGQLRIRFWLCHRSGFSRSLKASTTSETGQKDGYMRWHYGEVSLSSQGAVGRYKTESDKKRRCESRQMFLCQFKIGVQAPHVYPGGGFSASHPGTVGDHDQFSSA